MLIKRILMNAVDTGSGNGAAIPPTPTATPSEPSPQAKEASAAVSVDDFQKLATSVSDLAKSVNSLHAADRRAREGKAQSPKDDKGNTTPTADDPSSLLALRDAFDDATAELKLTKGQRSLVREYVMSKRLSPSDVDGAVADYVSKAGWATQATPAPAPTQAAAPSAPAQPKPQNERPVSDRGAPPAPQIPLDEADIVRMSPTDRDALIKQKGLKWYRDKLASQLKGRPVSLR